MITVICGTNRRKSNSEKIASIYLELLQNIGEEVQLLKLEDLPTSFVFDEMNGNGTDSFAKTVEKYIQNSDRFIFIIPEYNGSFPGVLKAFIDTVPPKYFNYKKAALVGVASGHAGALRPLDQFTHVLHHLKVEVFSDKPKLSAIEDLLDDDILNDASAIKRLENQIDKFIKF